MHCTSINDGFILGIRFKQKKSYCAYEYYLEHPVKAEVTIVCSRYLISKEDTWENRLAKSSTECFSSITLQQETEAYMRIIPHLYWALNFEYDSFVVLTNDTDVSVLLLRYCAIFLRMKLKNLYMKIGTGTNTRCLPVHELTNIHGEKQSRNLDLLKAHIATGCDWLGKLGTNSNALHKVDLLDSFGESDVIDNDLINATEEYLMSLQKGKSIYFKTFDEYIYHQYVTCNTPSQSLVSSSYCIRNWHIMRLFYLICRLSSLLDTHFVSRDHRNYSCLEKNGFLLPGKCLYQSPTALLKICKSCKGCSTKRYVCRKLLRSCTVYCGCRAKCQNIYIIVYE